MYLAEKGFPQDREDIKLMGKSYTFTGKKTPFKDDNPGRDWCMSFEKTWNVVLEKRKPELLTKARANDLSLKTLTDFLNETGLRTDPTAGKIFVRKTSKTAYYVASSCGKSMYTVLFCGSANGQCLPSFVVYKAIHLYDAWCQNGPENAIWIDKFIIHVKEYEKPVLLLRDGSDSHLTYSTVKKALDNHIILLCLPPNTTHALQPLDVGFFAPLRENP
ncbi:uncharacterized protein LOC124817170 [Hydra vulgaris]|uniref:uncharacterized protein LOC124817170 n=1 Tax=Hydra vulgaris TaxID=6087 RepID=UPI001F5F9AEA|nr:uncharacterized protein LOC124817170 [Hydra vulgaris]